MPSTPRSPTEDLTEYGQAPPMCAQFSVFLENRVGRLYDLLATFEQHPLHVVAFSVLEASDHAVVRLIVSKPDQARKILKNEKLSFSETELLIVELGPGQHVSDMCRVLLAAELNIFYAYSLMLRAHGSATVGVRCDDQILAGQLLTRRGFKLVDEEELGRSGGEDQSHA